MPRSTSRVKPARQLIFVYRTTGAEPMLPTEEIEILQGRIERELAQIVDSLEDTHRAGAIVELDQSSVGRLSRMDAMQQQAMAMRSKERLLTQRRRLDAALGRIRAGRFGACCQCGDELTPARLRADPAAPFCARCQDEIDARRDG
jgi:DnaK suppressor protein